MERTVCSTPNANSAVRSVLDVLRVMKAILIARNLFWITTIRNNKEFITRVATYKIFNVSKYTLLCLLQTTNNIMLSNLTSLYWVKKYIKKIYKDNFYQGTSKHMSSQNCQSNKKKGKQESKIKTEKCEFRE